MSPALLLAAALAATVSSSKLGAVVVGDDATSRAILAACPRLVVFPLEANGVAATQAAGYRAACAGGIVVVSVGTKNLPVTDSTTLATFQATWQAEIQAFETAAGTSPDAVEGPSEPAGTPTGLASFWSAFADFVNANPLNLRPVVGALATGMSGVGQPGTDPFCPTADVMRTKGFSWWWSYHARSSTMSTDLATELPTTLGYRQIRTDCTLAGVPAVITAAGPSSRAWQSSDALWLAFLDARLFDAEDLTAVVGAALAAAGTSGIENLAPVEAALVSELGGSPGDGGTPDGGHDGGGGGSVVPGGGGITGTGSQPRGASCATAGAGFGLLALVPALFLLRRRRGPG